MRAEPGGRFVISFHDGDLTGNDAAGNFTVPWEGLLVGSHVLEGPTQGRGFIRATLRIIPSSGDLFKVLKSLSSDPR